jgi:hypothetical protein
VVPYCIQHHYEEFRNGIRVGALAVYDDRQQAVLRSAIELKESGEDPAKG